MNMRNELLANVIFLMMLLACIAGASFGVARYSKSDLGADSKSSELEYRIEKMERAHQGVSANDLKAKIETLEKAFKVIESGHNRNVDILFNHDRHFDNHLECIRDLQRAVRNLTDLEETRQSSIKMLKERTDRLNEACGSLRQRIEVLESNDRWNPKVMLCGVTNEVYTLTTNDVLNMACPTGIVSTNTTVHTNLFARYVRRWEDMSEQERAEYSQESAEHLEEWYKRMGIRIPSVKNYDPSEHDE